MPNVKRFEGKVYDCKGKWHKVFTITKRSPDVRLTDNLTVRKRQKRNENKKLIFSYDHGAKSFQIFVYLSGKFHRPTDFVIFGDGNLCVSMDVDYIPQACSQLIKFYKEFYGDILKLE